MKKLPMIWLPGLPFALVAQPFNSVRQVRLFNTVQMNSPVFEEPDSVSGIQMETIPIDTMILIRNLPALKEITFSFPLDSLQVTSSFGMRRHPFKGKPEFHKGVDLRARSDTVRSMMDGKVERSGHDRTLGYYIRIRHGPCESLYGHLSRYFVKPGERTTASQPIGMTGNTGRSTGEHLHFSVLENGKPVDPIRFLADMQLFNIHLNKIKLSDDNRNIKTAVY
ncbi:MAG: M23 family metallopeptidase [Mangrovibacterium sp.]